jgi:phosphatidylinositol alpha-1,6-mannosyltransferase
LVLGLSRLVPRKGFDVLIEAAARIAPGRPDVMFAIGGGGRDLQRLERLAKDRRAPVRFLGRVPDDRLPAAYGCADVFAMLCRNRWAGLEQEGFGIVFLEAAACGVPQVAGNSGGAGEAVADGLTGAVVRRPKDVHAVTLALLGYVDDDDARRSAGIAARERAVAEFSYEVLTARLSAAIDSIAGDAR